MNCNSNTRNKYVMTQPDTYEKNTNMSVQNGYEVRLGSWSRVFKDGLETAEAAPDAMPQNRITLYDDMIPQYQMIPREDIIPQCRTMPREDMIPQYQMMPKDQIPPPTYVEGHIGEISTVVPETVTEPVYIPEYLRGKLGSLVRAEFSIDGNMTDRVGILREVGANYIILDSLGGGSKILCDTFSIKFVTIIESPIDRSLLASFGI